MTRALARMDTKALQCRGSGPLRTVGDSSSRFSCKGRAEDDPPGQGPRIDGHDPTALEVADVSRREPGAVAISLCSLGFSAWILLHLIELRRGVGAVNLEVAADKARTLPHRPRRPNEMIHVGDRPRCCQSHHGSVFRSLQAVDRRHIHSERDVRIYIEGRDAGRGKQFASRILRFAMFATASTTILRVGPRAPSVLPGRQTGGHSDSAESRGLGSLQAPVAAPPHEVEEHQHRDLHIEPACAQRGAASERDPCSSIVLIGWESCWRDSPTSHACSVGSTLCVNS